MSVEILPAFSLHEGEPSLLRIHVKAVPNSASNRVMGIINYGDQYYIKIAVTDIAEDNRANMAIIKYLARYLGIAMRDIKLYRGDRGKYKLFVVSLNIRDSDRIVEILSKIGIG